MGQLLWWRESFKLRPARSMPQLAEKLLVVLCRVLIFANRIKTVRIVHGELQAGGWRAVQLHGERSQEEREVSRRPKVNQKLGLTVPFAIFCACFATVIC